MQPDKTLAVSLRTDYGFDDTLLHQLWIAVEGMVERHAVIGVGETAITAQSKIRDSFPGDGGVD